MSCMLGPFIRLCMLIGCSLAVVLLLTFFAGYFVRQKSATWIAFFSSLIMMITDLFLYGQFAEWKFEYQEKKRKIEIQSSLSSVRLESLTHPSQESQKLPILDSARPLTLANSIDSGFEIKIIVGEPFNVRAYVREDILNKEGPPRAEITVFTAGWVEKKAGMVVLRASRDRSPDGRIICEGILRIENTEAQKGVLRIVSPSGITDSRYIIVRKQRVQKKPTHQPT